MKNDATAPDVDPDNARLTMMLAIGGLFALIGGLLYLFTGEHWWRLLLIVIAVPTVFWTLARARDRFMQSVAQEAGLSFTTGFPPAPVGSPAHGRQPWGFTGYTMSGQQNGVALHVYEHSYRSMSRGKVNRAHGIWWQHETLRFPTFDVRVRSRIDSLFFLHFFILNLLPRPTDIEMEEISFSEDQAFSRRFTVTGAAETQVRSLFTPELRKALLAELDRGTVGGKGSVLGWDRSGRLWGGRALAALLPRSDRLCHAFAMAARRL